MAQGSSKRPAISLGANDYFKKQYQFTITDNRVLSALLPVLLEMLQRCVCIFAKHNNGDPFDRGFPGEVLQKHCHYYLVLFLAQEGFLPEDGP